jgi:hypothetical protein
MKKSVDINRSQRLFIELGTPLLLEPEDPEKSTSGELVGMQVGGYLIVQLTEAGWKKLEPPGRGSLKVRYLCSGDVFGFDSTLLRAIEQPDLLVFLSYPEEVESCNVRSQVRVNCYLPVQVNVPGREPARGAIVNIHQDGCLCRLETAGFTGADLEAGTIRLGLDYALGASLALRGGIRSVRAEGGVLHLGIRFDSLDGYTKTVLTTLVPALKL